VGIFPGLVFDNDDDDDDGGGGGSGPTQTYLAWSIVTATRLPVDYTHINVDKH